KAGTQGDHPSRVLDSRFRWNDEKILTPNETTLSRIAYVNGRYVPHRHAQVHVEDRGFQFADAVYEVIAIRNGAFIDEERHLARLARSRRELKLAAPMSDAALKLVLRETARRNGIRDGIVYLQV